MKPIQDIVNDSGYPLQLYFEEIIRDTQAKHKWRVSAKEHRWVNQETHEDGYIDLVLEHQNLNIRLVVECKRLAGSWTFLLPNNREDYTVSRIRTLQVNRNTKQIYWHKSDILPETYESAYCVPEIDGKKDSRTIEKISGELLLSLESLASEELRIWRQTQKGISDNTSIPVMFYIPVIVTTSKIHALKFNPKDVDVANGKITSESLPVDLKYIRFCKNLATNLGYSRPADIHNLKDANGDNDRTVFIVQSPDFVDFLTLLANNF